MEQGFNSIYKFRFGSVISRFHCVYVEKFVTAEINEDFSWRSSPRPPICRWRLLYVIANHGVHETIVKKWGAHARLGWWFYLHCVVGGCLTDVDKVDISIKQVNWYQAEANLFCWVCVILMVLSISRQLAQTKKFHCRFHSCFSGSVGDASRCYLKALSLTTLPIQTLPFAIRHMSLSYWEPIWVFVFSNISLLCVSFYGVEKQVVWFWS